MRLLIHSLFSLLGPWTVVVACNTDYEAERRIIRWNSGGFVRQEDRQNDQTGVFYALIFFFYLCEHLGGNCQHVLMRNSQWVLVSVAWILRRLLIPCCTWLSIGLLMQCVLGWSHRFMPWDAFELVTSRCKWVLILTNVTASRNPQQKETLCWCSPCLAFSRPGKTFCDCLAGTVLAAPLLMVLSQSRCLFHDFQRAALHFRFVFTEKRKQVNTVSAVLAFSERRQPCRRLLCSCQLCGCTYSLVCTNWWL